MNIEFWLMIIVFHASGDPADVVTHRLVDQYHTQDECIAEGPLLKMPEEATNGASWWCHRVGLKVPAKVLPR